MRFEKLFWLAALTFIPALFFYYVGEEGSFTSTALEMWHSGNFLMPTLYGANGGRPPLLYWPFIASANLFGWQHMLLANRFVSIGATLLTAIILARLVSRVFGDKQLGMFTGLIFLTSLDLSLYRGWLAYADPVFALFVFAAISALWLAVIEKSTGKLILAVLAISCGFLSKALTAYIFYGITLFALSLEKEYRKFLFSPASVFVHTAMLAIPLLWVYFVPVGHGQGESMLSEIQQKLTVFSLGEHIAKIFSYLMEAVTGFLPGSAIAAYLWWINRTAARFSSDRNWVMGASIGLLNFLPYWLSPQSGIRYLLPIYPLAALVIAGVVWRCGEQAIALAKKWTLAAIALKIIVVLVVFPLYQEHYRGKNYLETAKEITALTQGYPLYINDFRATALSVGGYINSLRYPGQPPLVAAPGQMNDGFILNYDANPALGKTVKTFQLGGDALSLLCRGAACADGGR